ncbi:unnamed protein product [Darwinula stevensoni]|uniref:Uncharacterized protein n=1 Tax=Darwinula stevensoni TaxID=69355 RepID=A0A7R8XAI8_9CRUS|nr:unnamed protein product [Darwinula stevensoni]CAG0890317.1 unnamed protein product [Darwinula stevensoni]
MFANTYGKYKNCECGLVVPSEDGTKLDPIPLTKVSADVTWLDLGIKVTLTQTYKNKETKPVETQYVFPVDDRAAVCGFEAEIEGRKIQGEVRKKEEARQVYEESVKQGKTAFIVEETKPDMFQAKIGNLPAGSVATIKLSYVTEATAEGNALRFFLPTTIAPRYIPPSDTSEAAKIIGDIDYSTFSPCPMEIHVHIETERKTLSIDSPTHEINILLKNEALRNRKYLKTEVKLQGVSTDMDRDFVLLLETESPHQPRLILEKGHNSTVAAMVTLVPSFKLPGLKCDFIFVIDRSGSMTGEKMEKAKDALQLFLKSLPMDSYFNIVSFGNTFSSLWEGSQKYDEGSLHKASAHVMEMTANMGGTEILKPLSSVFQQVQLDGYTRQIIVLTDGEVSNTEQVVSLVRDNCNTSKTRVFALGVGSDASHHLVNGIALAGNGEALFAALKEGLSGKVQHLLKNSLQPSLTSVNIIWAQHDSIKKPEKNENQEAVVTEKTLLGFGKPVPKKTEAPTDVHQEMEDPWLSVKKLPCIFDGSCYAAYCIYNNPNLIPAEIKLSADTPAGPLSATFAANLAEAVEGNIVHSLAARSIIHELEEELQDRRVHPNDRSKKEKSAVYLGIKYNLASIFTSFVAVDEKGELQKDSPILRTVPNMMPHGYGGWNGGNAGIMCKGPRRIPYCSPPPIMQGLACRGISFPQWNENPSRPGTRHFVSKSKETGITETQLYDTTSRSCGMESHQDLALREESVSGKVDLSRDEGKLMVLTRMQHFNGSFPFDQQLLTVLGLTEREFSRVKDENKCEDADLATALAVVFMELKLPAYKDHWELMVKKSRSWLEGKGLSHLIDKSKQLLRC